MHHVGQPSLFFPVRCRITYCSMRGKSQGIAPRGAIQAICPSSTTQYFDKLESVRLTGGEISPKVSRSDEGSDSLTSEQKRKRQLMRLLENDFEEFHDFLDELIMSYRAVGWQREFVSEILGVSDYEQVRTA